MSPDREGNFIARWGVEMIAPSLLRDDRPSRILYEVLASMTKYLILKVLLALFRPKVVYSSM